MRQLKIVVRDSDGPRQIVLGRFWSAVVTLLMMLLVVGLVVVAMVFGYVVLGVVLALLLVAMVLALLRAAFSSIRR